MRKGGTVHLKTDDTDLFNYTKAVVEEQHYRILDHTTDLHSSDIIGDIPDFRTFYEESHIREGKTIKYLSFEIA